MFLRDKLKLGAPPRRHETVVNLLSFLDKVARVSWEIFYTVSLQEARTYMIRTRYFSEITYPDTNKVWQIT